MSFPTLFVFPVHFPNFFPRNNKREHFIFFIIRYEFCIPPTHNPLMNFSIVFTKILASPFICFRMNLWVQIIICFSIYVSLYRNCFDFQMGTSSLCHNEGVDDVNETIDLGHDVGSLEEVPNLRQDILEALNKESEGSKPNIEETEVINLADEGEKEKPVKIRVNFPKDVKDKFIALLKEFKEIFTWSYQDMPRLHTKCPLVW